MTTNHVKIYGGGRTVEGSGCDEMELLFQDNIEFKHNEDYYIGLRFFNFKNAFLNISSSIGNNKFYYTNTSATSRSITFPDGAYTWIDINRVIQRQQLADGDYTTDATSGEKTYDITLGVHSAQMRFEMRVSTSASVDFTQSDTFRDLLGWGSSTLTDLYNIAPSVPAIETVETIFLHCDMIDHSYFGSSNSNIKVGTVMESIPVRVPPSAIQQNGEHQQITYLPMKRHSKIQSIRFWVTDTNNNRVGALSNNEFAMELQFMIVQ